VGTDGSTILVVDDEAAVRRALATMLAHHGYDPLPAADGAEAIEVYRVRAGGVAAVVLDVRMPGLDGPATLEALRALDPALPCVFLTGDPGGYSAADLRARGAAVLGKPVGLNQLGAAVASALAPGGA
jgi:CheY-like chemotaxis protein